MTKKKIENAPNLIKDTSTGAVINTDKVGFERHRNAKMARKQLLNRIDALEKDRAIDRERIEKLEKIVSDNINRSNTKD